MEDDLQIDLENVRISMSERIFENVNFRRKFASRLKETRFEVSNDNLERIWEVLFQTVNRATRINWQIDELLQILMITSEKIFEYEDFEEEFAKDLKREGIVSGNPKNIWEALFGAVNSSVRTVKHVNLRSKNINDTEEQLIQMLLSRRTQKQSMEDYLYKPFTRTAASRLKSPEDIAKLGIKKDTRLYFVTNLIENQFSIQWDTDSVNGIREPEEFNFYRFCNVDAKNCHDNQIDDKARYLKYDPRRAHVMVQLYRFCKTKTIIEYSAEKLCPPVYIRSGNGWKEWDSVKEKFKPGLLKDFSWMNQNIYQCIRSQAKKIKKNKLPEALTKPTLYWALVDDKDFQRGNHLQLNNIGRTQVYVGRSKNGIKGRWLKNGRSHCKMMKKCLDNVQEMTTYDPLRLKEIQLVDARLLLAKLRKEKCALFVMKTYNSSEIKNELEQDEKAHIDGKQRRRRFRPNVNLLPKYPDWMPKNMAYGMNRG